MIFHASFNNIISKSYIENDYCHNELYVIPHTVDLVKRDDKGVRDAIDNF